MNRLFVRIYLAVALALFTAVASFVGLLSGGEPSVLSGEFEAHLEARLRPLATRLASMSEPERRAELAQQNATAGPVMALVPADVLELDEASRSQLQHDSLVLVGDALGRTAYLRVPGDTAVLEVLLLGHDTMRYQWSWILDHGRAGEPVDPRQLSPIDRARAYYRPVPTRLGEADLVVVRAASGGLHGIEPLLPLHEIGRTGPLLALLLTGVALLVVLYPVQRRLLRLSEATERFANGDLDVRVGLRGKDEVARLGERFDRMAERISALMTSKQELLRAVAHELRSPIGRVFYASALLRDTESSEERTRLIDGLDASLRELKGLTDELITYSRLELRSLALQRERLEAHEVFETVMATHADLRIEGPLGPDESLYFEADERLLVRALSNLVTNALRAASQRVVLSLERTDDELRFHVDDDGPGVPEGDRRRIFEPFVRLDESRSRDRGGAGLGLSIVKNIAERHDGEIRVTSSPLSGARFTFVLPHDGAGGR